MDLQAFLHFPQYTRDGFTSISPFPTIHQRWVYKHFSIINNTPEMGLQAFLHFPLYTRDGFTSISPSSTIHQRWVYKHFSISHNIPEMGLQAFLHFPRYSETIVNPLPDDKILDLAKLKEFADDNLKWYKNGKKFY